MQSISKRVVAEFVGTFAFVFVGAGSAVEAAYVGLNPALSLLFAALANGIGLAVAVSSTMGISGGHLNPAVSVSLVFGGKFKASDLVPYIVAQLLGSVFASYMLLVSLPHPYVDAVNIGSPSLSQGVTIQQGILLEAAMTFVLVLAVYGTAVDQRGPKIGGFGIGLAVLVDVLLGGAFTGAAMNPARAMGPMLASNFLPNYWYIYWVGPLIGGIVAGITYKYLIE